MSERSIWTVIGAIAVLENAVIAIDARTDEVLAALDFLEQRATVKWPFDQYRNAFANESREQGINKEGRRQVLNASLNGIRRAVQSGQR